MVFRNDTKSNSEVWVKNVVYREVFQSHHDTDDFPKEDIDELCSLLDDTFSSQLTSPVHSAIAPVKREADKIPIDSEPKKKINKLDELNIETFFPHNDNEINSMDTDDNNENSVVTHDCIFDGVIQDPFDFSVYFSNGSVNNLTLRMRVQLAKKIGLDSIPIIQIRERRTTISRYYETLQRQLSAYFDRNVSVYAVLPDGNCLYRALSHLIFGTEINFGILKLCKSHVIKIYTMSPIEEFMNTIIYHFLGISQLSFGHHYITYS